MTVSTGSFLIVLAASVLLGVLLFLLGRAFGRSLEQTRSAEALTRLSAERARFEALALRGPAAEKELSAERQSRSAAEARHGEALARIAELEARLSETEKACAGKIAMFQEAERVRDERMKEAFRSLSLDVLETSRLAFLDQAQATFGQFREGALKEFAAREAHFSQLVMPLRDTLQRFEASVQDIESKRGDAYASITAQFDALRESQGLLRGETERLVTALRSPTVRGRWGELQLRRVVEMAGMIEHCDFEEQRTFDGWDAATDDPARLRPDLVVKLPGGKTIVVDAKVALQAYLDAKDAVTDDERRAALLVHARQMRSHVESLASKAYWNQLVSSPDFVVMYVPLESAFGDALGADPAILEFATQKNVIPAGPMTLLSLLKGAGYGWRQERIARNAEEISSLGKDLYERLAKLVEHFAAVGESLGRATLAYNKAVGSMESRVLVSARRFKELGAAATDGIAEMQSIAVAPRQLVIPGIGAENEGKTDDEGSRSAGSDAGSATPNPLSPP